MAGTRSSARQAAKSGSSPASSPSNADFATGSKRKADPSTSPTAKRGKTSDDKSQTTIEDSLASAAGGKAEESSNGVESAPKEDRSDKDDVQHDTEEQGDEESDEKKAEEAENKDGDKTTELDESNGDNAKDAVNVSTAREKAVPSTVLEKGILYFFFRGRVGIEEPSGVADIARSYIVLRPLPRGAQLGDGPIGDEKTARLLALPKKVLPKSPKDRFMVFVEKAKVSTDDIKETFSASDYATKTAGSRHTPAAAPIGEGVYAFTQTGRDTHLAYKLTIPAELSDVQKDIGLRESGSYFVSAKNPEVRGPANAALPQKAEFPQEILDDFGGRGWMPLQPRMLDYENAQFLIIGHGDDALAKATEPQHGEDKDPKKETPLEEVEKLEHEDELRVKHLEGDDSVFVDLGLSADAYPKIQTTW